MNCQVIQKDSEAIEMFSTQLFPFTRMPLQKRIAPYAGFAALYDTLIGDHFFQRLRQAFEKIVSAHAIRFDSAADVACGTGTFVQYLCARGTAPVFGVDRSVEMLHTATAKNRGNGASFLLQDIRELQLPQPVDLLTCNFDSMNYLLNLKSLKQAFQRFAENLKPGGNVIFDMITDNQPWNRIIPFIEKHKVGNVNFSRRIDLDIDTGLQRTKIIINSPAGAMSETHLQRIYPLFLILRLLAKSGFRPLAVHDFDGLESVNPRSQRILVIARRNQAMGRLAQL